MSHSSTPDEIAEPYFTGEEAGHAGAHDGEHGAEGHEGGHHKGHGGGGHADGGHGGGGHGGSWLVTYCDMITLLIAFFICILTFSSKESGKQAHPKARDSVIYGSGGTGVAGAQPKGSDQDSIVWRQVLTTAHFGSNGSQTPPLYSDPEYNPTAVALKSLEESDSQRLGDSFVFRIPAAILFDNQNKLSLNGAAILADIAGAIHHLPYELFVEVDRAEKIPLALVVTKQLRERHGFAADRLGVGVHVHLPSADSKGDVWLTFSPRN